MLVVLLMTSWQMCLGRQTLTGCLVSSAPTYVLQLHRESLPEIVQHQKLSLQPSVEGGHPL